MERERRIIERLANARRVGDAGLHPSHADGWTKKQGGHPSCFLPPPGLAFLHLTMSVFLMSLSVPFPVSFCVICCAANDCDSTEGTRLRPGRGSVSGTGRALRPSPHSSARARMRGGGEGRPGPPETEGEWRWVEERADATGGVHEARCGVPGGRDEGEHDTLRNRRGSAAEGRRASTSGLSSGASSERRRRAGMLPPRQGPEGARGERNKNEQRQKKTEKTEEAATNGPRPAGPVP